MRRLLETDVVIAAIRGRPPDVRKRLRALSPDDVAVSAITVAELWYGAERSTDPERTRTLFEEYLEPFEVYPFDRGAAKHHGHLRHRLRRQPIGERDLLIASIAVAGRLTIATGNVREFRRVPGVKVEGWEC